MRNGASGMECARRTMQDLVFEEAELRRRVAALEAKLKTVDDAAALAIQARDFLLLLQRSFMRGVGAGLSIALLALVMK